MKRFKWLCGGCGGVLKLYISFSCGSDWWRIIFLVIDREGLIDWEFLFSSLDFEVIIIGFGMKRKVDERRVGRMRGSSSENRQNHPVKSGKLTVLNKKWMILNENWTILIENWTFSIWKRVKWPIFSGILLANMTNWLIHVNVSNSKVDNWIIARCECFWLVRLPSKRLEKHRLIELSCVGFIRLCSFELGFQWCSMDSLTTFRINYSKRFCLDVEQFH